MEQTLSATEARVHFGELVRRVTEKGQTVIVERSGIPQIVVLSVAEYRRLQASSQGKHRAAVLERAAALSRQIAVRRQGQPLTHPVEILKESREERDARYADLR